MKIQLNNNGLLVNGKIVAPIEKPERIFRIVEQCVNDYYASLGMKRRIHLEKMFMKPVSGRAGKILKKIKALFGKMAVQDIAVETGISVVTINKIKAQTFEYQPQRLSTVENKERAFRILKRKLKEGDNETRSTIIASFPYADQTIKEGISEFKISDLIKFSVADLMRAKKSDQQILEQLKGIQIPMTLLAQLREKIDRTQRKEE